MGSKSVDKYVNVLCTEKKKIQTPWWKSQFSGPGSWFLVPISQRNEIDSATTQQQTPRSNRKIHNEKQRWWRKDTEARNRRSPNQDGNLFEPPIFRQNSVKRETDSETDRKTDTLRERRNNGCRQGCNAPRIGSSNREKPCPALFKESYKSLRSQQKKKGKAADVPDTKGKCTNKSCNFAAKTELTTMPIHCKKTRSKNKLLTEHSPERRAFTVHNWNQEIDHNIQRKTLVLSLYSPRICKETNYVTHLFVAQNPRDAQQRWHCDETLLASIFFCPTWGKEWKNLHTLPNPPPPPPPPQNSRRWRSKNKYGYGYIL